MTMNGGSVFKKLHIWQVSISLEIYLSLFYVISPSDPLALWLEFRVNICDDLRHALHSKNTVRDPTEDQVCDYGLYLIDKILQSSNKSLKDWPSMPLPQNDWVMLVGNRLIIEQRSYCQGTPSKSCFHHKVQQSCLHSYSDLHSDSLHPSTQMSSF